MLNPNLTYKLLPNLQTRPHGRRDVLLPGEEEK